MGLFNKSKRLMDVIRCDEPSYLIWKWHPSGAQIGENSLENSICYGSSLRVKDGEVAIFVYNQHNGIMQDFIVGPFDQTIKTANLPILTSIVGLAYGGESPFQAEIYFINLAKIIQTRFAVPFFEVFDPRFADFGVPVAARGTISFGISDFREFIKLHRLINFNLDNFQNQIRDAVSRYVKDAIANAPAAHNIPLAQIETKTAIINDAVEYDIAERLKETFGVVVSGVDISTIEIDKSSEAYRQLMGVTKDIAEATTKAEAEAKIRDIEQKQCIEVADYEERLRIAREEGAYAQHMQTRTANIGAYQVEKQADVGVASAEALGKMGSNGAGTIDMGGAGSGSMGFNPATMMASMALGGAVGQNIAGTMNGILSGINQQQNVMTPPPITENVYNVAVNGQSTGPYNVTTLSQLAQTGQINATTLVWKPGMTKWTAIADIQDLASVLSFMPPEINESK